MTKISLNTVLFFGLLVLIVAASTMGQPPTPNAALDIQLPPIEKSTALDARNTTFIEISQLMYQGGRLDSEIERERAELVALQDALNKKIELRKQLSSEITRRTEALNNQVQPTNSEVTREEDDPTTEGASVLETTLQEREVGK